ncbi:unnamed protein product, partial [Closterium sp. NIES-53]
MILLGPYTNKVLAPFELVSMPAFYNRRTEIRLAARLGPQSTFLRPTIFPSAPLNMALPMPFTSARCPKADVTCFTGDGSSSVSKSARGVML